jgi:hypothetical protein
VLKRVPSSAVQPSELPASISSARCRTCAHCHGAVPAPLSRTGCSRQFGRASAPMIPHRVHTMRGPNDGTGMSSGQGSALSCRGLSRRLGSVVVCSCRCSDGAILGTGPPWPLSAKAVAVADMVWRRQLTHKRRCSAISIFPSATIAASADSETKYSLQ